MANKSDLIRDALNAYVATCVPPSASSWQIIETKRAFIAGVGVAFEIFDRLTQPDITDAMGAVIVGHARAELQTLISEVASDPVQSQQRSRRWR